MRGKTNLLDAQHEQERAAAALEAEAELQTLKGELSKARLQGRMAIERCTVLNVSETAIRSFHFREGA